MKQVTDVIEVKGFLGPADDILAVQNANVDAYSLTDWQKIHGIMMKGPGILCTGDVGGFDSKGHVIHTASPASFAKDKLRN